MYVYTCVNDGGAKPSGGGVGGAGASRKNPSFLEGGMHLGLVLKDIDQANCSIRKRFETY